MKLKTDYSPLVMVGAWNKHIFNPDWVGKYLLPGKELEMEFPVNADGSPRISTEDLRIFLLNNKLNFSLKKDDDGLLEDIESLSLKVADCLPHTPVTSFGMNFLFNCDQSCNKLDQLFNSNVKEKMLESGCIISSEEVKHSLTMEGKTINISVVKSGEEYGFNFNFHFDIKDLVEFKEKINNNKILLMKKKAIEILSNVYGLE